MYPHERSLVDDLKKEKFTLLGINSDATPEKVRVVVEREKLTWPIILDNGDTDGPIASKWGVNAWPTTYVIDQAGIIRFKNVREESMTEAVQQLLKGKGRR